MSTRSAALLLAVGTVLLPATAPAQTSPPLPPASTTAAPLDALLGEVRLLRQALERSTLLQTRAQLVVGRLGLQDQRLARARAELSQAEAEALNLTAERNRLRTTLEEMGRAAETIDPARQQDLEREVRMVSARSRELERLLAAAQERRNRAAELVGTEETRYVELERWFDDLDRELARPPR